MKPNKSKLSEKQPIETHKDAAWAEINDVLPKSNVPIPGLNAVVEAKEWVDNGNQK